MFDGTLQKFRLSQLKCTYDKNYKPLHALLPWWFPALARLGQTGKGETSEQIFARTITEWSPWKHTTCTSSGHEIATLTIFKMKQSLGISISGAMENEMMFPGGAASTGDVLMAWYELVSVDGESLQRVTHQHAVFSNKAKDPVVFVKILKGPADLHQRSPLSGLHKYYTQYFY